jgi:hypothetical protein
MAHFAEINKDNEVVRVLVTDNNEPDEGYQWLIDNLGGSWVKTSFNTLKGVHAFGGTPLRKNFAGIGIIYDESRDAFYWPQPYASWILNEDTCIWEAPKPMPTDGKTYQWVEADLNWQVVDIPQQ